MATPKKTGKSSSKKSTKIAPLSAAEYNIPKAEQINIEQLFAQALLRHKKDEVVDKKLKIKEISHLALMAEEYLSCFALIGYSLQNEEVVVFNMPTPKDEAALIDLLRATFIDIANNRP